MSSVTIPALRVVFWNVGGLSRPEIVTSLCQEHHVDVLILAELDDSPDSISTALKNASINLLWTGESKSRLHCFYRDELNLREFHADVSRKLVLMKFEWNRIWFTLGAAHLLSKLRTDQADLDAEAVNIATIIRDQEEKRRHSRTILIGDLNMNPFDRGVSQASGFHAVMSKSQVASRKRKVQGREYPFFYNPMWGHLGDRTPGPPGTYYYRDAAQLSYDWNTFDQVLLRPEVLDVANEDVAILDRCLNTSLLDANGRPDREVGSDHLPLLLTLRWKGAS